MAKNNIAESLKRIESRFDGLESRFDGLESKLVTFSKETNDRFDGIDSRLIKMRGEYLNRFDDIDKRFSDFRGETLDRFDHVFNKLDFSNVEYHAITAGMKRIEAEHRIIGHAEILKQINELKSSKN